MLPIRIKACSESDLRMLGNLARNIQRVLPVTQADIDAAAALGEGWVVWKVIEVNDPIDNLRGGTQLVIKQNSITPGQNVRRVLIVSGPGGETVVIGPGSSPLLLPDAIADSLTYVKAFGGTMQGGVPFGYTLLNGITNGATTAVATGIQPTVDDVEWELRVKPSTDSWYILQARNNTPAIWGVSGSQTGSTILLGWNGNQSLLRSDITRNTTHIYYVKATVKNGVATLYVKDETVGTEDTQTTTYTFDTEQLPSSQFYLFANGNPQYVSSGNKVFMARIKVGGVTVMDYVPALNPSNVVGFYDNATNTFKVSTSGTLVADQTVIPTPDAPMDIVSNNGVLKANTNLYRTEYKGYQLSQVDGITVTENAGVDVSGMVDCRTIKSFKITTVSPQGSFRIFRYRADNTFINSAATANIGDVITLEDNVGFFRIQYNFTNSGVGTENILIYDSAYNLNEVYADGTVETIKDSLNNTATAEMLLKVGDYKDVQSILDGVITRNVGVKVLDGTEPWTRAAAGKYYCPMQAIGGKTSGIDNAKIQALSNFFKSISWNTVDTGGCISIRQESNMAYLRLSNFSYDDVLELKQYLADQYANGTPVIVVYPLETETTESVTGQTLQVQDGDNTLEITQASLSGLELEAEYQKVA